MRRLHFSVPLAMGALLWACSSGDGPGDGSVAESGGSSASGGVSSGVGGAGGGGIGGSGATGGSAAGGSAGPSGGGPNSGAGGAPEPRDCENQAPELSVQLLDVNTVSELGEIFDTDTADDSGPPDWSARYGKTPEIVPVADGAAVAVLLQDQATGERAHLVHLVEIEGAFQLDAAYEVESLGRIMGLTLDEAGNYFVATGVSEDDLVDEIYPPNEVHRENIVRIVKFDRSGCVLMESDLDIARATADNESEIIVNPMVAGTSRLSYGAGQLALLHSHNTEPDPEIDGSRHQKAVATHIDAESGAVSRASTLWASHSFDQRLLFDGTGHVELHLGDAYPRSIAVGRYFGSDEGVSRDLFHIKGPLGENMTFTRLGGIVTTPDPEFGYLVLFATERTPSVEDGEEINGTRDLGLVRVRTDLAEVGGSAVDDGSFATEFLVNSSGEDVANHLRWLTSLAENRHVERPRITALPGGEALALWEEWTVSGNNSTFEGVFALRLDSKGETMAGPSALPETHHISRGDDAITVGGRALYVGGSASGLDLNFIAPDLSYERIIVP